MFNVRRAFMWGAKSGKEQLAPFPEPTHAAGFACAVPNSAKQCVVGFTSKEAFDKAHKMVRRWPYCNCSIIANSIACMHDPSGLFEVVQHGNNGQHEWEACHCPC